MLERTPPSAPGSPSPRRRLPRALGGTRPVAALTAAAWAAAVGLVVVGGLVTLVWAVGARGDDGIGTPLQAAGVVWLAAHHAPVDTPASTVTLLPLLLLVLVLLLLVRAGRWAARISRTTETPDAVLLVVTGTAAYACVAALVAEVSGLGGADVPTPSAFAWAALVSGAGLGTGVARETGLARRWRRRLPDRLAAALPVAAASGASLVVAAGLVAAGALLAHWGAVLAMTRQAAPGAGDAVGLLLVQLAYLPNLIVWALSYLAGPGFAVGGGTVVDPFSASGGLLPGVPVLGAVPLDAPAAGPLLLLLPVVAGVVGTVVLRRRGERDVLDESIVVLVAAGLVGLASAVACLAAGGSLGDGRLADVGPSALATGLAVAGLVGAGGLVVTLAAHLRPVVWVHDEA